ncbi:uroporphyrinogen-III synthase [Sphingobium sp. SYK-6]|uniref:uroporphyrinogen-III synthase n=1 Tax=Sphingobium sp. (strain NBRC 103272 / SYK-6) TaxID=627192 RepID=UPI0002276989|nr:uroporphyrinogen-III synthase [Sphingobium sp. SYK-6]BAK64726.1 uroporphyrinogen-III synthase [Sphingobium sp. SYK-6]
MKRPLVLLRPQPGNDASAKRARALGMDVIQIPLFEIAPTPATALPDGPFDALLVTSINGARHGEAVLRQFADLPVFTVGDASAQAVRDAGGQIVITGQGDAASTIPLIRAAGHGRVLHLCGDHVRPFDAMGIDVVRHVVYCSEARDMRPFAKLLATLPPSVIAVHSPRAGRRLNALMPPPCRNHVLLAISEAAAKDSGGGWRQVHVSPAPDDTALLRLATSLCMGTS